MNKRLLPFGLCLLLWPLLLFGDNSLRVGVADSDGPPIAIIEQATLKSGIAKDIGEALAQAIGRSASFVVIARKRVEWALANGTVDIICNANPAWYSAARQLGWTSEVFPQAERIATLISTPPLRSLEDLEGKRISTIRGYSYPAFESMWATGEAIRTTEDRLELMMKAVVGHIADAAIVSELGYAAWAKKNPESARQIRLSSFQSSTTPTMCAVSPKSSVSINILNHAIDRLRQQGKFKTILHTYQWQSE